MPKVKRTAEQVEAAKKVVAESRKKAKVDEDSDNLRNRLFRAFGDAIRKKDGGLPSHVKLLASLVVRTWSVLKRGKDEVRPERVRTVTVGLETVLTDSPVEGITADFMADLFTKVSDHASKVRVNASLLANWIFIKALQADEDLPEANGAFFTACLSVCRGARTQNRRVKDLFTTFSAETEITAFPTMSGVTRVFENQATDMATAASNFLECHFSSRQESLLKWGLTLKIRPHVNFTTKVFDRRIAALRSFILSPRHEMDAMEAVRVEMRRLGFEHCFGAVEPLCAIVLDFVPTQESDGSRLRHLLYLQEVFLTHDRLRYEEVCAAAHAAYPKLEPDTNKAARSQMIRREWGMEETPPKIMSPLPICHTGATFIRLCKKSIVELIPALEVCIEAGDPWWYKAIMDPFSRKANIPCLRSRSNRFARSEKGVFKGLKLVQAGEKMDTPWMVGPSLETDGKQIKLNLITSALDHGGVPGLVNLKDAGYRVSFENIALDEALAKKGGVYNLQHLHAAEGLEGFDGVTVTPVDPGQVCVVEGAHISGEAVRLENAHDIMFGDHPRVSFSGEDWQIKTLTRKSNSAERYRSRDGTEYGAALLALRGQRKKTCDPTTFMSYCRVWGQACGGIWKELLTVKRRGHRFLRFRAIQRTVEEIAEEVAPIKGGAEKYGKRIVMFEDGVWKPKKGCAAAPLKKIVRAVCQRAVVAMVPCAWSTKTCLGCGRETEQGVDYRTRLCTTSPGCSLHPHTPTLEFDRDLGARGVIGVRGVYVIAGLWSAHRDWRPVGYEV